VADEQGPLEACRYVVKASGVLRMASVGLVEDRRDLMIEVACLGSTKHQLRHTRNGLYRSGPWLREVPLKVRACTNSWFGQRLRAGNYFLYKSLTSSQVSLIHRLFCVGISFLSVITITITITISSQQSHLK